MEEPNIKEVAGRIRALREDFDLTMQEMADATGRSVAEYAAQESGEQDLSFTFLYKCAKKLGVDIDNLLVSQEDYTGLVAGELRGTLAPLHEGGLADDHLRGLASVLDHVGVADKRVELVCPAQADELDDLRVRYGGLAAGEEIADDLEGKVDVLAVDLVGHAALVIRPKKGLADIRLGVVLF